jgi:hypothetical protein
MGFLIDTATVLSGACIWFIVAIKINYLAEIIIRIANQ